MKKSLILLCTTFWSFGAVHFYNNTKKTIDLTINDRMTGTMRPQDASYSFSINPVQAKTITVALKKDNGLIDKKKLAPSVITTDLHYLVCKKDNKIRVCPITIPKQKDIAYPIVLKNKSDKEIKVKVKQKGSRNHDIYALAPGEQKRIEKLNFVTSLHVTAFDAQNNKIAHCQWAPFGPYMNVNPGVFYNIEGKKTKRNRYRTWIKPKIQVR